MKTQTDDFDVPYDDRDNPSPPPRSSLESVSNSRVSTPNDYLQPVQTVHVEQQLLVEPNFDEGVLRALCELDVCRSAPNFA